MKHKTNLLLLALVALLAVPQITRAQSTAFTYQGNLKQNGSPANGAYDFQFGLFTGSTGGSAITTVTSLGVGVTNGLFTTTIDFGSAFNGASYYLDVAVRTNGSTGAYTELSSRQAIGATPYALYAPSAGNVTGVINVSSLPASVALLNSSPTFTGTVKAGSFSGDGSGLTNLPSSTTQMGYLFAYDLTTQAFPTTGALTPISFSVPGAQRNGWALSPIGPASSTFTASNSGLYLFHYDATINGTNGRTANIVGNLNNSAAAIAGSQGTISLMGTNAAAVATLSRTFVTPINSNDVFRLEFTADGAGVNLATSGANNNTTNRPSVSLTIIRVN